MPVSKATLALVGETFDLLTVVGIGPQVGKAFSVLCSCSCGNPELVQALPYDLRSGRVTSCKCKKTRRGQDSPLYKGIGEISASFWRGLEINAERSSKDVLITIEEAWDLFEKQKGRCALTGRKIRLRGRGREITASLDRIDPNAHYTPSNVLWVDKEVNRSRKAMPLGTYVDLMVLIDRYQHDPHAPPPVVDAPASSKEKKPFVTLAEGARKMPTKDMVGKQFGYWEIRDYDPGVINGRYRVWAIAECQGFCEGGEQRIDAYSIRRGASTMCLACAGHLRAGEAHVQFEGIRTLRAGWLSTIEYKVKQRNLIRQRNGKPEMRFELTVAEVWDMYERQGRRCSLSRLPLHFGKWHNDTNASLDRFDADGHYTRERVHLVHKDVNLVRDRLSLEDFRRLAHDVATHAADYATGKPYNPVGCLTLRRTRAMRERSLGK